MRRWIAQEKFRCVPRRGKAFALSVLLGEPETVAADGKISAYGRMRVSLRPLSDERWVAGINQFQALCISIDYVRRVLKVFVAEGGRVYWRDTDGLVDLDNVSFLPMPSLDEFKKPAKRRKSKIKRRATAE